LHRGLASGPGGSIILFFDRLKGYISMPIKLRQLSNALAVWRHGSFRRAAEEQHLSQPALSRSVQNLEQALAVTLFDRESTELRLTAYGESFLARAEAILVQAADLEREMHLMKDLSVGRLSVAMGTHAAEMSGIRAAKELLSTNPGLQLRLKMRNWREVERMVRQRQVDLGFGEIAHLSDVPELRVESVGAHEMVIYCRPGHPLLNRDTALSPADIDAYPGVGVSVPPRFAQYFPLNCTVDAATGDIAPRIYVEEFRPASEIVAGTDAFGLATPLQLEPFVKTGKVVAVPFMAPWLRVQYGFILLASRSVSPAAQALMALVRNIEREVGYRNRLLIGELLEGSCAEPAAPIS
jgi:DNA-binding transcriptional LysR family regulator